jgi:hypothetical protein
VRICEGTFTKHAGHVLVDIVGAVLTVLSVSSPLSAEAVSLQALVTPSTVIVKDGRPVAFAIHGFIEFKSLAELFPYIESQTQRWNVRGEAWMTSRGGNWRAICCGAGLKAG